MNTNFYIPKTTRLQNLIHSFWQVDDVTVFNEEYIIPKGVVEIVFNFSDGAPIPVQLGSRQYQLSKCFINGFNTVPISLSLPRHHLFFGVQLQPMAVRKILKTPANKFADIPVDLSLFGSGFNSLWHQLADKNFENRITVFCNWLDRNEFNFSPQEKLINDFLYTVDQHDLSVPELASTLCYSTRHLSRKLFEATGMNTEEVLLYKKYLHAIHLMHYTDLTLTQIAYESNFFDQSHFIKSFKSFAYLTPGDYQTKKGSVKGHIYKDVR